MASICLSRPSLFATSCHSRRARFLHAPIALCALLAALCAVIAGCGGSITRSIKAGPLVATGADGSSSPLTALAVGGRARLTMMPSGDTVGAGVDWRVVCGGNPVTGVGTGACGTFSAAHTADGAVTVYTSPSAVPVGTTVTISATVTSNPSQSSSLSLTIVPGPIAVSFSLPVPATLQTSGNATLSALVTNDPTGGGVIWTATCGAAACGSFNPVTTPSSTATSFTAPSVVPPGESVTVTATSLTDTTRFVSAMVKITPPVTVAPPPPIAVSLTPSSIYVERTGAFRSSNLTAVVLNDPTNAGVNWSLRCNAANCGSITSHSSSGVATIFQNTSTIAVGGTITVTATSMADPSKNAMASVTVVSDPPAVVSLSSALPKTLDTGSQATLIATSSGSGGVDWSASCGSPGGCGTFNVSPAHTANGGSILYQAPAAVPAGSVVTIAASPATTGNAAVTVTTVVAAAPLPVTLSFSPAPPTSLLASNTVVVGATVAHDVAPGGVAWSAVCGNAAPGGCGWFTPIQTASGSATTFTAPPVVTAGTSVTLVATSVADPTVKLSSDPITITPDTTLSVHFIPSLPAEMETDATVNLVAAVANDQNHAGVDWQVCVSGCGFFTLKPALPAIPATAITPFVAAVPAVTATSVTAWPTGLPIPYTAPSQVPSNSLIGVIASAHVDPSQANSGTIQIHSVNAPPAITGVVQAGTTPVAGASLALYAAGTAGYASPATQISTTTQTDVHGSFTLPAGYGCPQPDSQIYLLATGGAVGKFPSNPSLALMTVIGACSSLGAGPVVVNEVTTVASAFVAAPFAANDALNGNSSYRYLGSSSTNTTGLANAFAAVHNLVDIDTGKVRFRVPAENAFVPFVQLNTLADILNSCANSSGGVEGDGSACGTLFSQTDLLGADAFVSSIGPSDTLQAVFNIAQHPVSGYGYTLGKDADHPLLSLVSSAAPFQPVLAQSPADWSLSVNFSGGGGIGSSSAVGSLAVDGNGNLWITDRNAATVAEWSALGAAVSPAIGYPAGSGPLAIDSSGNVWVSGDGALAELTPLGSPLPWSPFGGVPGGGSDALFDKLGDLWIANGNGVSEFSNLGIQLSPSGGFTFSDLSDVTTLGIDSLNNVWVGAGAGGAAKGSFAELANPGGLLIQNTQNTSLRFWPQTAADGHGDVWAIQPGTAICEYKPYAGKGSVLQSSCYGPIGSSFSGGVNVASPRGVAIDGAGTVWVAGQALTDTTALAVLPLNSGFSGFTNANPYLAPNTPGSPLWAAVDGSGNVWVLLSDNTLTEYIGAGAPVVTPIARAIGTGKVGVMP